MAIIPNSTQVPNYIIDEIMPTLNGSTFKILLVIIRQTLGWIEDKKTGKRKEKDWISYTKLQEKTGLHRESISMGLKELEEKDLIEIFNSKAELVSHGENTGKPKFYRLKTMSENPIGGKKLVGKSNQTGRKIEHTKETITKVVNTNVLTESPKKPFLSVSVSDVPGVAHTKPLTSYSRETYSSIISYMAKKLGVRFPNYPKQMRSVKMLLQAGNSPATIKQMVDGALNDPYWKGRSPDFATIYSQGQKFLPKKLTPQDAEKLEFANIFIKMVKGEDDWKKKANSWTPEKRRKLREFLNDQAAGKTNG